MGIIDAYSPTQGVDFVELRAVADSAEAVSAVVRCIDCDGPQQIVALEPAAIACENGTYFWRATLSGLKAGASFHVEMFQDGCDATLCVEATTLLPPPGVKLMRFAILSDLHINHSPEPGKRLREHANSLARSCIERAAAQRAEMILFPGDVVDTHSARDLETAQEILSQSPVPIAAIVGNHDEPEAFHAAFGIPECGYYSFDRAGVHFVMLSTPNELALAPGSEQMAWLEADLEAHRDVDTLVFSHYSFVAHAFYEHATTLLDNGKQYLVYGKEVCDVLARFPRVRAVFAGHNNVPTFAESKGVAHMLCAQPIQGPCGFDIVDVYEGGFIRMVQEIDEQHLVKKAKDRVGGLRWSERVRPDSERNVSFCYEARRPQSPDFCQAC